MFNCTEYNTVDFIFKDALKNYNRRPSLKNSVSKEEIMDAMIYIGLRNYQEQLYEECLQKLYGLNKKLADYLTGIHQPGIEIDIDYRFINMVRELAKIDEQLTREEAENFGFGPEGRKLRKEWRGIIRECHKYLNKSVKNKILYIKEWSKPRQVYVLNYTGEVHNGLYWTFRELIAHPTYIKYGFKKEER